MAGPAERDGIEVIGFVRRNCKAWDCGYCGPKKASQLQRAIQKTAPDKGLTKFLTLTLDPRNIPEDSDSIKHIRQVWSKFRVYLRRRFNRPISFITVLEFHRSGVPHLHILIDRYIPQCWLSQTWDALGGGRIVDIRRVIDVHRLGFYLTKYLTKDLILSAPKGTRRWTTSRDIRLFDRKKSSGWKMFKKRLEFLYKLVKEDILWVEYDFDNSVRFFGVEKDIIEFV